MMLGLYPNKKCIHHQIRWTTMVWFIIHFWGLMKISIPPAVLPRGMGNLCFLYKLLRPMGMLYCVTYFGCPFGASMEPNSWKRLIRWGLHRLACNTSGRSLDNVPKDTTIRCSPDKTLCFRGWKRNWSRLWMPSPPMKNRWSNFMALGWLMATLLSLLLDPSWGEPWWPTKSSKHTHSLMRSCILHWGRRISYNAHRGTGTHCHTLRK